MDLKADGGKNLDPGHLSTLRDFLNLVMDLTADGGKTWTQVSLVI